MALDPQSLMSLPPEFQAEMQKLLRQRQMAQMMQQQAVQPAGPTQVVGGYAVKQNPLQPVLQALTGYMAGRKLDESDKGVADVLGRYQKSTSDELATLLASDNPRMYAGSSNPRVAAMAAALMKQRQEQGNKTADILKDTDPAAALRAAQGNLPGGDYVPPKLGDPTFSNTPGGNEYAIIPKPGGGRDFKFAPKATSVSVDARQGVDANKAALEEVRPTMKSWQEKATAAKEVIQANGLALDAMSRGAKSGGLEGLKQSLRGIAQGFGVNTEKFTETTELQMAVGNAILANARKLAPVTGEDIKRLETILGSVNTDPTALQKMLTEYNGMAAKTLQDANRYFEQTSSIMPTDLSKGLVQAGAIGHEMIPPPGNTSEALRAIQTLQRQGGDVTQFAVGGEQIPANAQFNIRGATPPAAPGAPAPKKPVTAMTPQEIQAELAELRKRLGLQ